MAQSARDAKLESRTNRLKLKAGTRHWKGIGRGLALGYRRTKEGFGTWSARLLQSDGKYALKAVGAADDYDDANGVDIFDFFQAQDRARILADFAKQQRGMITKGITVATAAETYLIWYKDHRRAYRETEHSVRTHILPALGEIKVHDLTKETIENWRDKLATRPARLRTGKHSKKQNYKHAAVTQDEKRARKATANRIFSVLKALLNYSFEKGKIGDDSAWRRVKPFRKVDEARIRFLTDAEGVRLVNACPPDLRRLVNAALLTGARFGELAALRVADVKIRDAQIYIADSKSGKPRYIPLNIEGVSLFRTVIVGKLSDDLVFVRKDGSGWGKNHHVREFKKACEIAKIIPPISFHELRHTYASHLAQASVDLLTISNLLGHADTRITSKHYAHLTNKHLASAVTNLPSFQSEPILEVVNSEKQA